MNKNKLKLSFLALCAATCLWTTPAAAQVRLADSALPMIVTPHRSTINYQSRVMHIDVAANLNYHVTCDADWVKVKTNNHGVYLALEENYYSEPRTAMVKFADQNGKMQRTLLIEQGRNESASQLPHRGVDITGMNANMAQPGEGIERTMDGDTNTLYHSPYSGGISPSNPAILTYNFSDEDLESFTYVPRTHETNGIFQEVDVKIKHVGERSYTLYKHFSWPVDNNEKKVSLGEAGKHVSSIQFVVTQGKGGFASCAEMRFESNKQTAADNDYRIFTDDLYTQLRPDFTEENADTLTNPFVKSLAMQLLKGKYDTKYRVASYVCHNSPQYYSRKWCAPGKLYDQIAGVTGINIPAKSYTGVVVRGIPDDIKVELKIVAWYEGKEGTNFDGGNPVVRTYVLQNGVNPIYYDFGYDGLAYICYYSDGQSKKYKPIRVHFVNGQVNGYLSPDKTNEEMHEMTANAKSMFMDVVANKVHAVWTAKGLHDYCKSVDRKPGYRQYMNILDSLITWEHRLLGFEKYDHVPDLRTMAYVNFTYYMFQGSFGVSFHHNQESRVLNCNNLINHDHDAIWGLSHEWGHQHQMAPYFNWSGMSEVTNNMNSYYNTYHMGFVPANGGWLASIGADLGKKIFAGTAHDRITDQTNDKGQHKPVYAHRQEAYDHRNEYAWSPEMMKTCEAMNHPKEYAFDGDHPEWAFSYDAYQSLRTYVAIYQYCTDVLKLKDFGPDYYEALRQNDNPEGSTIEKQDGIDKYEIIASAQNNNTLNRIQLLRQKYPNSCWVKDGYITEAHCHWTTNAVPFILNYIRKVSRISGYNLFPYFERAGFLRQVALRIDDYGIKWYVMTPAMYNEFKADMQALEDNGTLKHCDEAMVQAIFDIPVPKVPRPQIPN